MDPFVLWLTVALAGVGAFAGWMVKWALAHLESDLAFARKASERGASVAEKAVGVAEEKARA